MTHLIAGYPSLAENRRMLEIMSDVGVDLIEVQMPFSEPVADGPLFVRANQEALAGGLRLADYFDLLSQSASTYDFPHLMMGYYNTVFRLGHAEFCRRLSQTGSVGYILPDLPVEEYGDLFDLSTQSGLSSILLMTPTNTTERLAEIGERASGFVYAVARKGVTGKRTELDAETFDFIGRCRAATELPLALGFGLASGEDLRLLQGKAEVGIVGSALLSAWETGGERQFGESLRDLASGRD